VWPHWQLGFGNRSSVTFFGENDIHPKLWGSSYFFSFSIKQSAAAAGPQLLQASLHAERYTLLGLLRKKVWRMNGWNRSSNFIVADNIFFSYLLE
jgi:hypothetical protein